MACEGSGLPDAGHANAKDAERVAALVLAWAERIHGSRAFIGRRPDTAARARPRSPGSALDVLATRGVRGLTEDARCALLGIHAGTHRALVAERPFSALEVIALQAEGRRCVSLLPEDGPLGPYATPLAFAAHDLEHLHQFFDPGHHEGQLGFFRRLHYGLSNGLGGLVASHDDAFLRDVANVGADTNGSCVFAFASVVMKLKMASRRSLGRITGQTRDQGALTAEEEAAFAPDLGRLLDGLGMPRALLPAAARVGNRRRDSDPEAGREVLAFFVAAART